MWRTLWDKGLWPRTVPPVWHGRRGDVDWHYDLNDPTPTDVPTDIHGVIVLAGCTAGDAGAMSFNEVAARAALDMARQHDLGPVLLCSSQSVYTPQSTAIREDAKLTPASPYGKSKAAMEAVARRHSHPNCALRIANVAGADMVLLNAALGPVVLDQLPNGQSPERMYITPLHLIEAMLTLLENWEERSPPPVLNIAQPGLIHMSGILDAANAAWAWKPAPPTAIPTLSLDLATQSKYVTLPTATAQSVVDGAANAGWPGASS